MSAYGWKATIGFIGPPRTNETVLQEAFRLVPEGISWCWSVMGLPEFGRYQFEEALSLANVCARELADREVSVIVLTGIPLITARGPGSHVALERQVSDAIGGRLPVTSDMRCVLGALRALSLHRIAVTSIYQRFIQDNLIAYLRAYGVDTLADEGLEYALADCLTRPTMTTSYDSAMRAFAKDAGAEGMFLACPQWPVISNIERIERDSGHPVVTHLGAILWGALGLIGVREPRAGYGRLLAEWPAWSEPVQVPSVVSTAA